MKTFDEWCDSKDYDTEGLVMDVAKDAWNACAAEHQKLLRQYRDMLTSMENLILKVIELHPEIKDKL